MTATATRPRSRRAAVRRYLPPQHGAWAMLLLPYLCGVLTVAPLAGAWLSGADGTTVRSYEVDTPSWDVSPLPDPGSCYMAY